MQPLFRKTANSFRARLSCSGEESARFVPHMVLRMAARYSKSISYSMT